jgi:hypothetical protein
MDALTLWWSRHNEAVPRLRKTLSEDVEWVEAGGSSQYIDIDMDEL